MNVCVFGCWHLGTVTAAGLASLGHTVIGLDRDEGVVAGLNDCAPPLEEPGLADTLAAGLRSGLLSFTTSPATALEAAAVLWVAIDTPVDEDDSADPASVIGDVLDMLPAARPGTTVLVSSQLPVGSTAELERRAERSDLTFGYSPENLRLGHGLSSFLHPDRIVVGVRQPAAREVLTALLTTISDQLEWVSVESAELAKHALNAYLATSIAFTNEIASIAEVVGASAHDVERVLRSEPRVGRRAYVSPGAAFAGGTLARDVRYLEELGGEHDRQVPILDAVMTSNDLHRAWPLRVLEEELGPLAGRRIAVLGLTYTPGTSTLRRSAAVELLYALVEREATVRAHDPAAEPLPSSLSAVDRRQSAADAVADADAVVILTGWPEYRALASPCFAARVVVDPEGLLRDQLGDDPNVRYRAVGEPR